MPPSGPATQPTRAARALAGALAFARDPITLAVVVAAIAYIATAFRGVGGVVNHGDSAKFQFMGLIGAVSHPPGNPLYMVIDVIVAHLPLGGAVAPRITAISIGFGLAALYVLGTTTRRLTDSALAGVVTVLLVGLGPLYWTLSTEAEVYTLNATLVALTFLFACRWALGDGDRWLAACLFVFALSFANHLTVATMIPAVVVLCVSYGRRAGWRALGRIVGIGALGALAAVALYAYVPLRVSQGAAYSELHDELSVGSLLRYVTAREFHREFGLPSLVELANERLPDVITRLQRQWIWPALVLAPLGIRAVASVAPRAAWFLGLALVGQLVFPLAYHIDDPDGFYVPIVVLLGVALGASVVLWQRRVARAIHAALLLVMLVPLGVQHWKAARARAPNELVEDVDELREVGWDLPDLVARAPEGARILAPCGHYGCAQVLNYFRFADEAFARKHLEIAHLPGAAEGWHAPWPEVDPREAQRRPICTIIPGHVRALRAAGLSVREIPRGSFEVAGAFFERPPLFCSP